MIIIQLFNGFEGTVELLSRGSREDLGNFNFNQFYIYIPYHTTVRNAYQVDDNNCTCPLHNLEKTHIKRL